MGCACLPSVFPSFTGSSIPAHSPDPNSVLPTNRRMPSQRGVTMTIPTRRLEDDMGLHTLSICGGGGERGGGDGFSASDVARALMKCLRLSQAARYQRHER